MKLVIYARVSSQEQVSGYSLDAQVDLCRKWATEQGHEVVVVFVERGKSARTDERPEFQRAIKFVLADGAEGILVHKSDRFARNLLDSLNYRKLFIENEKMIFSVTEGLLNDKSPSSKLLYSMGAMIAEYVSDNIGKEAQKGRNQKAKSGSWPGGKPPLGYIRKDKAIITDKYAASIQTAFREFATEQYTLATWADQAAKMGIFNVKGDKIRATTWGDMFRNIFYTGRFVWNGEEHVGNHPAIIDLKLFNKVGSILEQRNSGGTTNRHFWLLKGLIWSKPENQPMHGSIAKGNYFYYKAKEHHVKAQLLEDKVFDLLRRCVGYTHLAPEYLRIALMVAPNLALVYEVLPSLHAKKEFLEMVFMDNGLVISWGGAIVDVRFRAGYHFIGGSNLLQ